MMDEQFRIYLKCVMVPMLVGAVVNGLSALLISVITTNAYQTAITATTLGTIHGFFLLVWIAKRLHNYNM